MYSSGGVGGLGQVVKLHSAGSDGSGSMGIGLIAGRRI